MNHKDLVTFDVNDGSLDLRADGGNTSSGAAFLRFN